MFPHGTHPPGFAVSVPVDGMEATGARRTDGIQ